MGDDNGGSTDSTVSRRTVLRTGTALGVGAVGLTAATSPAQAGELKDCVDWESAPHPYPTIDVAHGIETRDVPTNVDELCLYAHGWNGRGTSDDQAHTVSLALEQAGYTAPVVAVTWDSDTLNFWGAERNATTAGERLAEWVRAYREANPGTTIRLVGHSLGGRVSLAAITALDGDEVIETVALLGAAVDDDTVCDDGEYASGIERSAGAVSNYHSRNDSIVCVLYGLSGWGSGVGCDGADCDGWFTRGRTPDNYEDREVTDQVEGHCDFPTPDAGCMDQVVADF